MDHFRYPIGQFVQIHNPTAEQRNKWIKDISGTVPALRETV